MQWLCGDVKVAFQEPGRPEESMLLCRVTPAQLLTAACVDQSKPAQCLTSWAFSPRQKVSVFSGSMKTAEHQAPHQKAQVTPWRLDHRCPTPQTRHRPPPFLSPHVLPPFFCRTHRTCVGAASNLTVHARWRTHILLLLRGRVHVSAGVCSGEGRR